MINIKRFIDKVSAQESRGGKDVVLSLAEARMLKDEIVKLLADRVSEDEARANEPVQIEIRGGNW